MSFFDKFPYTNFHELNLDWVISQMATVKDSMLKAVESAKNAKVSEENAKTSETNAKTSETNAKTSETNAKTSETNAKTSETNAKTSQNKAQESSLNASRYLFNITNLLDNIDSEVLPEMSRIEDAVTAAKNEAINAKTLAKTSETNAKTSETNAKNSEINASASASQAQSTVYYYDTGEIDCTQGLQDVTSRGLALTMRVILRNGFMYIYGTLAPNVTETIKNAGSSISILGGIIGLKYNALNIKAWIDEKLPNIDWDNLCGSCSLHGYGEVAVTDASTSSVLSPKMSIETIGGVYYYPHQTSSGTKVYLFRVRIVEIPHFYVDKSIKYDPSNCVSSYTLIMPIKFK